MFVIYVNILTYKIIKYKEKPYIQNVISSLFLYLYMLLCHINSKFLEGYINSKHVGIIMVGKMRPSYFLQYFHDSSEKRCNINFFMRS